MQDNWKSILNLRTIAVIAINTSTNKKSRIKPRLL